MNRVLLAMLIAGLAAAVAVAPAAAQVEVGNLAVSSSESRDDVTTNFPYGTTEIYALFDYDRAANHNIGVTIMGFGLTDIYSTVDRYDGEGHAAALLTGSDMYRSLADNLVVQAGGAYANAKKAADQATGRRDFLDGVRAATNAMGSSLSLLEKTDVGASQSQLVADVRELVRELDELVGDAREPDLDEEEQKARAAVLKQPAADLEAAAEALAQGSQSVEGVPFPSTGTQSAYTLQVTVTGSPADSLELQILEEGDAPASDALGSTDLGSPTSAPADDAVTGGTTTGQTRNSAAGGDPAGSAGGASASDDTAGGGESGQASSLGSSGTSGTQTAVSSSPGARATSEAMAAAASGGDDGSSLAGGQDQQGHESVAPVVDESEAPIGEAVSSGPVGAEPTWTVPALAAAPASALNQEDSAASNTSGDGGGGSSGPNLAVLGIGAVALIGVALWLRQRA